MTKSAKNSTASKPEAKLIFSGDVNQYGEFEFQAMLETTQKGSYGDFEIYHHIWSAYLATEDSCCGFYVLGSFDDHDYDISRVPRKASLPYVKAIGKELDKRLDKKMKYVSAYVPNQKQYDLTKGILNAAGFKPQVSLKSNHGKYTNTRWEWFGSDYREVKPEKVLATVGA